MIGSNDAAMAPQQILNRHFNYNETFESWSAYFTDAVDKGNIGYFWWHDGELMMIVMKDGEELMLALLES